MYVKLVGSLFPFLALAAPLAAQPSIEAPPLASHPPEVALMDEGNVGWVYRETTKSLRLYTRDGDPQGQSTCSGGCASAWPPLRAPANATPVGNWTVVDRADGTRQWAFRGKPVYMAFHDSPDRATGAGVEGWRLIPYFAKQGGEITRAQARAATSAIWDVIDVNHDGVVDRSDKAERDAERAQAFRRIDANGNGELSQAELGAASPEFRSQMDAVRATWFMKLDTDKNGGLSRAELVAGGAGERPAAQSALARLPFDMADSNKDGRIVRAEFDAAVERHLDLVDANRDGKITNAEYEAGRARLRSGAEGNRKPG